MRERGRTAAHRGSSRGFCQGAQLASQGPILRLGEACFPCFTQLMGHLFQEASRGGGRASSPDLQWLLDSSGH